MNIERPTTDLHPQNIFDRALLILVPISPETLLNLNVSTFKQLRHMGTSKQRICDVLNISVAKYDYVNAIA